MTKNPSGRPGPATELTVRKTEAGPSGLNPALELPPYLAETPAQPLPGTTNSGGLTTATACLVIAVTGWYLLKEFAPLLRPLLLAVFLCYVIYPSQRWLTRSIPTSAAIFVLASASVGLVVLLALQVVGSASRLSDDMPAMIGRGQQMIDDVKSLFLANLPPWLALEAADVSRGELVSVDSLQLWATLFARSAADSAGEAVLVCIYLIFLLLEAPRVPHRIQAAFSNDRSEQILVVIANINQTMARYLHVKVKASLVLAVPATLLLWAFGLKSAFMWGMLTFLFNFIPYLGSVFSCAGPILLTFLETDALVRPTVLSILLISIHMLSAYLVEPAMTGRAVNLSPVVILVSLSFWWLCWGFTGMILAVPLTVLMKIILENIDFTRPLARLVAED